LKERDRKLEAARELRKQKRGEKDLSKTISVKAAINLEGKQTAESILG